MRRARRTDARANAVESGVVSSELPQGSRLLAAGLSNSHRRTSRGDVARAYAFVAAQFGLLAALAFWHPHPDFSLPHWLDTAAQLVGLGGAAWIGLGVVALGRSVTALPLPVACCEALSKRKAFSTAAGVGVASGPSLK